jgi:hypothetical protein
MMEILFLGVCQSIKRKKNSENRTFGRTEKQTYRRNGSTL